MPPWGWLPRNNQRPSCSFQLIDMAIDAVGFGVSQSTQADTLTIVLGAGAGNSDAPSGGKLLAFQRFLEFINETCTIVGMTDLLSGLIPNIADPADLTDPSEKPIGQITNPRAISFVKAANSRKKFRAFRAFRGQKMGCGRSPRQVLKTKSHIADRQEDFHIARFSVLPEDIWNGDKFDRFQLRWGGSKTARLPFGNIAIAAQCHSALWQIYGLHFTEIWL